ncbi:MAG: SGNH/GDSL hydrolase family protein [Planktotalea sp.]|uniref:SGNH/GDSL hydrolase family protein n=1 Tax=Planktotalea sp. TaxID=2029877 RepID=UPI003C70B1BE
MRIFPPLDIFARVVCFPVLAWQALSVARNTLVLPEAAGPRSGTMGEGPELRLLILGDSSAAGVGVANQSEALAGQLVAELARMYRVNWTLIARSGATTRDATEMLDQSNTGHYDVVLLALGVNDAIRLLRLEKWRSRQRRLRNKVRKIASPRAIVVTEVPPLGLFPALPRLLRWVLGAHAARMGVVLVDDISQETDVHLLTIAAPIVREAMAEDGYHPSATTYTLWTKRAAECINALR